MTDSDEYELELFEEQLNNPKNIAASFDENNNQEIGQIVYTAEPYEPPESLWQLIKSVANEQELDVIKSKIGEAIIETSIDLHNEIDTLLEIWRDYRNETMVSLNQIKQTLNKSNINLPEPPNIRETLKKEIKFFVTQMRELYKEEDKFCRQIVSNNHNLNVINYALNSSSTETVYDVNQSKVNLKMNIKRSSSTGSMMSIERPQTSIDKRTGVETPIIINTSRMSDKGIASGRQSRQKIRYRPVSRCNSVDSSRTVTSLSNYPDDIKNTQHPPTLSENLELAVDEDKINCMQIDEIADHLRVLLKEECDTLKNDIEFLYDCIDKEKDYRVKSRDTLREPSLNELKEERKRLEAGLISSTGKNQIQISKLPSTVSTVNNNRSIHSPIMTNRISPSPPSSAAGSIKPRSPLITATKKPLTTTELKKSAVKQTDASTSNSKFRSSSLIPAESGKNKTDNVIKTTAFNSTFTSTPKQTNRTNLINSSNIKSKDNNLTDLRPILSRTNSVSSIASSVASSVSVSSNNSKQSAAQKFRQMVLEHRD